VTPSTPSPSREPAPVAKKARTDCWVSADPSRAIASKSPTTSSAHATVAITPARVT
jgi:hypothetical protein